MKKSKDKEEAKFELTPQGSLGILALGSVGIRKWREVVNEAKASRKKKKDE